MNLLFPNHKFNRYFLPFTGGLIFAIGFPTALTLHFFFMPILGLFLLLQTLPISYKNQGNHEDPQGLSWKTDLLSFLCFSLGSCGLGYYWIPYTLKEFGAIIFPFNFLLGSLFSLIIFPQYLLFILACRFIDRRSPRWIVNFLGLSTKNILLAFLITTLEYYTPQQFPTHLGHAWLQLAPNLGLAPFFGVPLFSFASSWMALTLLGKLKTKKWDWLGIIFFIIFLTTNLTLPLKAPKKEGNLTTIRMVQANIGNFMKISGEEGEGTTFQEILDRYFQLSTNSKNQVDLILWPETAYPQLLNSSLMKANPQSVPEVFQKTISLSKAQLIAGGYDQANDTNPHFYETEYNTIFYFNRESHLDDIYHKRILMPFGESLPFGPLNPLLAKIIKNISFFAEGKRFPLFKLDNGVTLINAICYEILFSNYMRGYLNHTFKTYDEKAQFILNITNDSWYGESAEPYQHQFLSHWRAIEFQIPIVRMTNTGLSSILYPDGSQSEDMGLFQTVSRDYQLFTKEAQSTLFQEYGFSLTFGFSLVLFLLAITKEKTILNLKKRGSS